MKHLRGTKWSRYGLHGNDSAIWKAQQWNSTCDMLMEFLKDDSQSKEDRSKAAEILQWAADRKKARPDLESDVIDFLIELDISPLWESPDAFQLQPILGKDGTTSRGVVCIQSFMPVVKSMSAPTVTAPDMDGEL